MRIPTAKTASDYMRYAGLQSKGMAKQQAIAGMQPPKTNGVEQIRAKLQTGQRLTPAEMDELKRSNPDLYSKAMQVERERQLYETTVRMSRTRNEANDLLARKVMLLSGERKLLDNEEVGMRISAIRSAHNEFQQSSDYARLP